jgi:aspartate-semialdehyde dehydrogenase
MLSNAPGVLVVDDPERNLYPMPLHASKSLNVEVGRIRQSLVFDQYGVDLFVCGDQLLRGAAWNAVLIMKSILQYHF